MRHAAFPLLLLSQVTLACTPADVSISKITGSIDHGHVSVVGTLTHQCAQPTGVQVKLSVYDRKGNLMDVQDQWPASINNIPPNKPYNFSLFANKGEKGSRFTVEPIAVKQWR